MTKVSSTKCEQFISLAPLTIDNGCCVCQVAYTTGPMVVVYAKWHTQQAQWLLCMPIVVVYATWHTNNHNGCCVCQVAYTTYQLYMPSGIHNMPNGPALFSNWHTQQPLWPVVYVNWHTQQPLGLLVVYAATMQLMQLYATMQLCNFMQLYATLCNLCNFMQLMQLYATLCNFMQL
jgi:hypothetical protein